MKKQAFSLIEIVILGGAITLATTSYINHTKQKILTNDIKVESTDIASVKVSLQAYAAIHGQLPFADSDGDGKQDTNSYTGTIPYKDLQITPYDKYGSKFIYDVTDSLTTTTTNNVCSELENIVDTTKPILYNNDQSESYNVAAVVISKGANKTLDGINADSDRTYTMTANAYADNSNDDKIIEITKTLLITKNCTSSSSDMITFNGKTYYPVTSPNAYTSALVVNGKTYPVGTKRVWLDRNLGADQVCTSSSDSSCYGDYYQWGRLTDGHEKSTSGTQEKTSDSDVPGSTKFFTNTDGITKIKGVDYNDNYDWRYPANDSLWQGVNGINNPCPTNYRIPTREEFSNELTIGNITSLPDAYDSFFKLSYNGTRLINDGTIGTTTIAALWTSTIATTRSFLYAFHSNGVNSATSNRATGVNVRCIKD